jgi:protein arginine kinase activator
MKKKCDNCDKPATIHLTEISGGEKIEKHLCPECAEKEGIAVKTSIPISQLLEDFVLQTPGGEGGQDDKDDNLECDACGITFREFRDKGMLGCPNDYKAFGGALEKVIARSQDGATRHVGKVPENATEAQRRESAILRIRGELKDAVRNEDYMEAARLRDWLKRIENRAID